MNLGSSNPEQIIRNAYRDAARDTHSRIVAVTENARVDRVEGGAYVIAYIYVENDDLPENIQRMLEESP